MYTILVTSNNELVTSVKERIMQRSKLVDNLHFLVEPVYKGYSMADFTVTLEYILPVSREYKTETLVLSESLYKDRLEYKLPFDTNLTKEAGKVEMQLTFTFVDLDENGNSIQRVRKTSATVIEIVPITAWSDIIPDSALSALDQRLIKLDAQMRGLNEYVDVVNSGGVDNIVYNEEDETLQLTSRGVGVGDKVSVRDMLDDGIPVVDLDSDFEGDSNPEGGNNNDNNGNCDCEDDVVEFGYSSNGSDTIKPLDDDNVVEF